MIKQEGLLMGKSGSIRFNADGGLYVIQQEDGTDYSRLKSPERLFSDKQPSGNLADYLKFKDLDKTVIKSDDFELWSVEYDGTMDGVTWIPGRLIQYTYEKKLLSRALYQEYRTVSGEWLNSFQILYAYNRDKLIGSETNQIWDNVSKSWINRHLVWYYYDSSRRIKTVVHQRWEDHTADWIRVYKDEYQYHDKDLLLELKRSFYQNQAWVAEIRYLYKYDDNNNLVSEMSQLWREENGIWENNSHRLYYYNSSGQSAKEVFQHWDSVRNRWRNEGQTIKSYGRKTGNLIRQLMQKWDTFLGNWNNETQYVYTYYPTQLMKKFLIQGWSNETNSWFDANRFSYAYDREGRMLEEVFENKWNDWVIEYAEFYTYDKNGNLYVKLTRHWKEEAEILVDSWKTKYYYRSVKSERAFKKLSGKKSTLSVM